MQKQIKVIVFDERREYGLTWVAAMKKSGFFAVARSGSIYDIVSDTKSESPDFIIIGDEMIGIIGQIRDLKGKRPKIIVYSENYYLNSEKTALMLGADEFIKLPIKPELIVKRIRLMDGFVQGESLNSSDPTKNIEFIVTDVISKIGIPANVKGYYYLRAAVILMLSAGNEIQSITKHLYPVIAEHYNTTSVRVERAIRHAIGIAWENNSREYYIETFGYSPFRKPTNFELISTISDRLKLKYYLCPVVI